MMKYLKNSQFFSKGETTMPNVSDIRVIPNAYTCSCDGGIKCHKGGIASPDGLFLVWVSEGDEDDVLRGILRTEPLPAKEKT